MDELIKRLRNLDGKISALGKALNEPGFGNSVCNSAADLVERLQAENAKLRKQLQEWLNTFGMDCGSGEFGNIYGRTREMISADFPKEPDK